MNKHEKLAEETEKKYLKRDIKRRKQMKVSGKKVLQLKKIIVQKSSSLNWIDNF